MWLLLRGRDRSRLRRLLLSQQYMSIVYIEMDDGCERVILEKGTQQ